METVNDNEGAGVAMSYKSRYTKENIEGASRKPNLSGKSAFENITIEERAQNGIANAEKWYMARWENYSWGSGSGDTRPILEQLGFIIHEETTLFYTCTPPQEWTKSTNGYWTTINDDAGARRGQQFYKGAWYDECAFLTIK